MPVGFGTGVQIQQIRSVVDTFLGGQILSGQSSLGRFNAEAELLNRVEAVFGDLNGAGIDKEIQNFFAALNDLSNNPTGSVERAIVLERGKSLSQALVTADGQLKAIQQDANSEIESRVGEINALSTNIANLNQSIRSSEQIGGAAESDLRDERTRLLNELSEKIGIQVIEEDSGNLTVITGSGGATVALISGDQAATLSAVLDPDRPGFSKIVVNGNTDITHSISDGRLRGLIELRDALVPDYRGQLDRLAASLVYEFNSQHQQGFGLDGTTETDFFAPVLVDAVPSRVNQGTAKIEVTVSPVPEPPDPSDPDYIAPEPNFGSSYELSFLDGNFKLRNLETGEISSPTVEDEIIFEQERIQINIKQGSLVNGDRFRISLHQGAAGAMAVQLSDPRQISAASQEEDLPGGNDNAILLAQLQSKQVSSLRATFQGFYAGLMGEIGNRVQTSERNLSVADAMAGRLDAMREEKSGVSLDEEMTNLISFQRAYQASAKLIVTADELLQTVIGMKQ